MIGDESVAMPHSSLRAKRSNPAFVARQRKKKAGLLRHSAPRKKLGLGKAAATIKTVVARLDRAIEYAAAYR
jgi:hypothetical protein